MLTNEELITIIKMIQFNIPLWKQFDHHGKRRFWTIDFQIDLKNAKTLKQNCGL